MSSSAFRLSEVGISPDERKEKLSIISAFSIDCLDDVSENDTRLTLSSCSISKDRRLINVLEVCFSRIDIGENVHLVLFHRRRKHTFVVSEAGVSIIETHTKAAGITGPTSMIKSAISCSNYFHDFGVHSQSDTRCNRLSSTESTLAGGFSFSDTRRVSRDNRDWPCSHLLANECEDRMNLHHEMNSVRATSLETLFTEWSMMSILTCEAGASAF